jgi:hypothetical protein
VFLLPHNFLVSFVTDTTASRKTGGPKCASTSARPASRSSSATTCRSLGTNRRAAADPAGPKVQIPHNKIDPLSNLAVTEVKLPFSVKRLFKSNAFIEDEAQKLQVEAEQVLHCQEWMNECCGDLEDTLAFYYPNCKAYPFGSRISGLGNNVRRSVVTDAAILCA